MELLKNHTKSALNFEACELLVDSQSVIKKLVDEGLVDCDIDSSIFQLFVSLIKNGYSDYIFDDEISIFEKSMNALKIKYPEDILLEFFDLDFSMFKELYNRGFVTYFLNWMDEDQEDGIELEYLTQFLSNVKMLGCDDLLNRKIKILDGEDTKIADII